MRQYELLALAGALSVSSSRSALAQLASSGDVTELEAVTVTATKTERPAFEVAGSVSVVTTEEIETEQPQSVDDLLKARPVVLFSGPRRLGEEASIRGFSDERIVTTLDGARQNFSIGHQWRGFDVRNSTLFSLAGERLRQVFTYGVEYYKDEQEGPPDGRPR